MESGASVCVFYFLFFFVWDNRNLYFKLIVKSLPILKCVNTYLIASMNLTRQRRSGSLQICTLVVRKA